MLQLIDVCKSYPIHHGRMVESFAERWKSCRRHQRGFDTRHAHAKH